MGKKKIVHVPDKLMFEIQQKMKKSGIKGQDLAKILSINPGTVSRWFYGNYVSEDKIKELERLFNINFYKEDTSNNLENLVQQINDLGWEVNLKWRG